MPLRRLTAVARPIALSLAALAACLGLAACSGPALEGNVFRDGGVRFRVGPIPEGWRRIDADGARLAFRDDAATATVLVNARCGADADDAPLPALTNHLFLMFTERQVASQKLVALDGREALHTIAAAKLDGVPKSFDVYVLKKDGCVYDFVQIAQPDAGDAVRAPFERFVAAFHTIGGAS